MADDQTIRTAETAEARRLFEVQHRASRAERVPDAALRRDRLARLRSVVAGQEAAFARAISDDFGVRSRTETELLEIVPTLNAIKYARRKLGGWMKPERRHVSATFQPARAWVRWEPLGVIGIISPWNYPLQLAISPLVDAIAAGNRAMVKPSELTPAFSDLLKRLIAERFDEVELAVVTGGVEVGQYFASLPFDHLLFTGSTAVGRKVYQAAAANLTPVTLELGGKSPAIVCPDYALDKAAKSIAFGKFVNAGQTCIAPDYVLVPRGREEAFAQALMAQVRASYPTLGGNDDYSGVISPRHRERLERAVAEAKEAGARVLVHEDEAGKAEGKVGPTLVLGAPENVLFLTEEIFGPVLPIVPYDGLDQAIDFVNRRDRPLALYCFSRDRRQHDRVLDATLSGGVTLNGTLLHVAQESLPFGGVGPSGIGAYHGREGFRRFSHARAVHKVGFVNVFEKIGPPWGGMAKRFGRMLAK
ncbi:MAG: coniferyl aldehyde dehydrogenase [Allosphingosinicella sp.]|uniref:coniferyl aldehyde dehydrogenase n=1 Tax=Allosphingosinicella sp. TaxID=2823234 RepID=UPI00392C5557